MVKEKQQEDLYGNKEVTEQSKDCSDYSYYTSIKEYKILFLCKYFKGFKMEDITVKLKDIECERNKLGWALYNLYYKGEFIDEILLNGFDFKVNINGKEIPFEEAAVIEGKNILKKRNII